MHRQKKFTIKSLRFLLQSRRCLQTKKPPLPPPTTVKTMPNIIVVFSNLSTMRTRLKSQRRSFLLPKARVKCTPAYSKASTTALIQGQVKFISLSSQFLTRFSSKLTNYKMIFAEVYQAFRFHFAKLL